MSQKIPVKYRYRIERLERLCAALLAHIQRGVPEGWQLVPKEPTKDMVEAAYDNVTGGGGRAAIYAAMLAAAPAPDQFRNAAKMMAVQPSCMTCTAPAPAEVPMPEPVGWYVSGSDPEHAALWRECPDDEQMQVMNQQCDDGPVVARPLVLGADAKRYGAASRDAGAITGYARGLREMRDCRTCRNYTRDGCIQTAQCVDGDGYRRAIPVRFWSTALRGEVK